jgi:hypothetical protein
VTTEKRAHRSPYGYMVVNNEYSKRSSMRHFTILKHE